MRWYKSAWFKIQKTRCFCTKTIVPIRKTIVGRRFCVRENFFVKTGNGCCLRKNFCTTAVSVAILKLLVPRKNFTRRPLRSIANWLIKTRNAKMKQIQRAKLLWMFFVLTSSSNSQVIERPYFCKCCTYVQFKFSRHWNFDVFTIPERSEHFSLYLCNV